MIHNTKILAAWVAVTLCASTASATTIDTFNDGNGTVQAGAGGSDVDISAAPTSAIGGQRTLIIPDPVFQPITGIGNLTMQANNVGSGVLAFSLDAGTSGSGNVAWAGLGGVDLTDGGTATGVEFEIIAIDQGDVDLELEFQDTTGDSAKGQLLGAGVGTQSFTFGSFIPVSGTLDFTDVDNIFLAIDGVNGSDLILDQIQTINVNGVVPEPTTFGLSIFGLLGMLWLVRRPRKV